MFTYDQYLDIINIALAEKCSLFIRHDVDFSPKKAVQMAEIELNSGIQSTYYILLSSPYYNFLDKNTMEMFRTIREMGHQIGLHYDLSIKLGATDKQLIDEIIIQIGLLEYHIGPLDGMSVTSHKPFTGKDISNRMCNMLKQIDVYSHTHDKRYKYIADSGHNWRYDPIRAVLGNKLIHINTHPEWYNDEERNMEECLHGLNLPVQSDKLIEKEIKHIKEYLVRIKGK